MNRVSAETDIRLSMRSFYAQRIAYPKTGGYAPGVIEKIGDVEGVPYGDLYEVGDVFLDPVGDNQLGLVYYVAEASPGSNRLLLQLEASTQQIRPRVVVVSDVFQPEVTQGARVHIGIRSRPTARGGYVRALHVNRLLSNDGQNIILASPFWRGSFWLHVEGVDRLETSYVFEMVNSRQKFITDIYKFEIDVFPIRADVVNLENGGVFRNVLTVNVNATVTPATPIDQLPDGMPTVAFPYDPISGVSPVIEQATPEINFPWYAERVGDYPLSQEADDANVANMPPTE